MSNEDLYGPGFSDEDSDSVLNIQRLLVQRDEAMEYAKKCEDDLKRNTEQFHFQVSQCNATYNRQYRAWTHRVRDLESQNQMKDELLSQQALQMEDQRDQIMKLKEDVARLKSKLMPRCPSPRGKIYRSGSLSPTRPHSPTSSALSTPTRTLPVLKNTQSLPVTFVDSSTQTSPRKPCRRKKEPSKPLPRLKLNKRGHSNPPPFIAHDVKNRSASNATTLSEAACEFEFPATMKANTSLGLSMIRETTYNSKDEGMQGKRLSLGSVSLRESDENQPALMDTHYGAIDCAAEADRNPQPMSMAVTVQQPFRGQFDIALHPHDYPQPLPVHTPLMAQQISAAREEHRLSLGDVADVHDADPRFQSSGSSGSETDASSEAETDVSYMSDNQYDMEDMDMHAASGRRTRTTLRLQGMNPHSMRKSMMTLEDVCDTVVSPVKSIWTGKTDYFPDTQRADTARYPLQIVVNDEHGGKMAIE